MRHFCKVEDPRPARMLYNFFVSLIRFFQKQGIGGIKRFPYGPSIVLPLPNGSHFENCTVINRTFPNARVRDRVDIVRATTPFIELFCPAVRKGRDGRRRRIGWRRMLIRCGGRNGIVLRC